MCVKKPSQRRQQQAAQPAAQHGEAQDGHDQRDVAGGTDDDNSEMQEADAGFAAGHELDDAAVHAASNSSSDSAAEHDDPQCSGGFPAGAGDRRDHRAE
jgi:hypothetical protein